MRRQVLTLLALNDMWKSLKKLRVGEYTSLEFIVHINTCMKLEYLSIEEVDFNLTALNGEILRNLSQLHLATLHHPDSYSMLVLKLIHDHCRLLKSLRYLFKPTAEAANLLLDIIRLNPRLISVSIQVNDSLLHEIAMLCSQSLTSISLQGNSVDFNTMVHVLQQFEKIDTVGISSVESDVSLALEKSVKYVKSVQSLSLYGDTQTLSGWKEFAALMPELREIDLWNHSNILLNLGEIFSDAVVSLSITSCDIAEEELKLVLQKCSGLTQFTFNDYMSLHWPNVINYSNKIEKLTIEGPNDHVAYLLSACRYLTEVSFTHCTISHAMILSVADTIKKYRHAATEQSLQCKCIFDISDDKSYSHQLNYDGTQFSGNLWWGYGKMVEEKDESISRLTDRVKELEAEVEALKKQQ